jgi:23S rRNA (adenine2030-N6)-methyltransferase
VLSYQHAYHAGNAADCHKHLALVLLLRRLQQKVAPICYSDSHAGRGVYDLEGAEARKTNDAAGGILRLAAGSGTPDSSAAAASAAVAAPAASAAHPPPAVRDFIDLVHSHNKQGKLRYYPGSAVLAQALLREQDRAILLELHPQEHDALEIAIGRDRRVSIHARDCFEGLPALLPPPIRRGLVLIDPSYEVKDDYEGSVRLLGRALQRFGTGVYLLWYPLLPDARESRLLRELEILNPPKTLISEFRFSNAAAVGLQGSGLAIVNTPWQFDQALAAAMEHVAGALVAGGEGGHELSWLTPE